MSVDEPRIDPGRCDANAAPYVLGALPDDEHEAFRAHLESCAVCREEVASLQAVAAALPSAAHQMSAPPQLKRRVMATVEQEARLREARHASAVGPAGDASPRVAGVTDRWLRWRPNLAVAVLAAAVMALAVVALAGGGGIATRAIRARVLLPRASASLTISAGRAQLDVADMPQAGPGRIYEVWRKGVGAPQPTDALFTVSSHGSATVAIPGGVTGVREVLVTSEPLGGSPVPTRAPVILARVS